MITLFLFYKLIFKLLLLLHVHHLGDNLYPSDGQIFAMCIHLNSYAITPFSSKFNVKWWCHLGICDYKF
jgi:hypothetical protein